MAQEKKEGWQNSDTQLSNNPTEEEKKSRNITTGECREAEGSASGV